MNAYLRVRGRMRGRRPILQSRKKNPRRMLIRAGQLLFSMMSFCRCFARRVKLHGEEAPEIEKARRRSSPRGPNQNSFDGVILSVFCPTCQTSLRGSAGK
jgi:hypothetical protein